MAYEAYEWADGEAGNTPIFAARLNALEQGVEDASEAAEAPTTWASVTGKPSTFAPATHSHVVGDVTGLQAALDGKQASGSYATASALADLVARVVALEEAAEPEA